MAFLLPLLSSWRVLTFGGIAVLAVLSYALWGSNQRLSAEVQAANLRVTHLVEAREKDAVAAKQVIEAMEAEKSRLQVKLRTLSEIKDAPSRKYLEQPVPDAVRRLLNAGSLPGKDPAAVSAE